MGSPECNPICHTSLSEKVIVINLPQTRQVLGKKKQHMSPVDKVDTIALESLVLNEIVVLVCQKLTDTQEHISETEKMQIRLSFKPTAHIHAVLKTRASYAFLQRDLLSLCCSSKIRAL